MLTIFRDFILNLFFTWKEKNDIRKLLKDFQNNQEDTEPVGIIVYRSSGKLKRKYGI
ncbi:hypothetical protein HNQ85_003492 [Anoxybacillus calidus]|uniref:Uncharacterized protein n=1 Tax=[Anoxybacillus] calidus TaxID=575178 RepID=A0A7V9Z333_9BACL|nr:hypothetical protein [Anoxybacillus calidus]